MCTMTWQNEELRIYESLSIAFEAQPSMGFALKNLICVQMSANN